MARLTALLAVLAGLLLPVAAPAAVAQSAPGVATPAPSADALFYQAAGRYIDGDAAQARRLVERGLRRAPDHPRLRALKKKLDEQKKKQQQSGNSQKNQQKNKRQKNDQNQQQGRQKKKEQQKKQPRKGQQKNQQRRNEQKQKAQPKQQNPPNPSRQQQQGRRQQPAGQAKQNKLSKEQAERILRAMRSQEKQLLRQAQKHKRRRTTVEKDW